MPAIARTAALSILLGLMLAGCAGHPPRGDANTPASHTSDTARPSIFVPTRHSALAKALKRALTDRGWRLIGYDAARNRGNTTTGNANYQAMARRGRYRLTLSDKSAGPCHDGGPGFVYRITIIENQSGNVPVSLAGAKCLRPIVDEFTADLDQKQLAPAAGRAMQALNRGSR